MRLVAVLGGLLINGVISRDGPLSGSVAVVGSWVCLILAAESLGAGEAFISAAQGFLFIPAPLSPNGANPRI